MQKSKILLITLAMVALATSCEQSIKQEIQPENIDSVAFQNNSVPYQTKLSPSILKIIQAPNEVRSSLNLVPKDEFDVEYVDHFKFFTEIDKTGSAVEEILEHDGYVNAHKYVVQWRKVLGENMDWPDHKSTTYTGPFPALEHGFLRDQSGWFGLRTSYQKSDEYYNKALSTWKKGVSPTAPEQKEAWEWLGRTAHFIQDSTVPHHSMSLTRPDQLTHSPFEKKASENFKLYFPSKNYNPSTWNAGGPYPSQGQWGIYTNRGAKDIIKNNSDISHGLFKIANHKEDETNGNWDKVRSLMLPLATKTCAGLVVTFLEQVGEKP
ncbi:MAG: hypothetical protein AABZ74_16995 [Cyanobacteriota bacterium]